MKKLRFATCFFLLIACLYCLICKIHNANIIWPWKNTSGETISLQEWWAEIKFGYISDLGRDEPPPPPLPMQFDEFDIGLSESEREVAKKLQSEHYILRVIDLDATGLGPKESTLWRPDWIISYAKLSALSPTSIFSTGPHNETQLNLHSNNYGHYSSAFLEWLAQKSHALYSDRNVISIIKPLFPPRLNITALAFWDIGTALMENDSVMKSLSEDYHNQISAGFSFWQISTNAHLEKYPFFDVSTISSQSDLRMIVYFWIRRFADGSGTKLYSILSHWLKNCDMLDASRLSHLK